MVIVLVFAILAAIAIIIIWDSQGESSPSQPNYAPVERRQYPRIPQRFCLICGLEISFNILVMIGLWKANSPITMMGLCGWNIFCNWAIAPCGYRWKRMDALETCLLDPIKDLDISGEPPQQLTYQGNEYRLEEASTATMTRLTSTGQRSSEQCVYYDYEGPDGLVLSIEDWGGQREITAGKAISPKSLTILPGDGASVYR